MKISNVRIYRPYSNQSNVVISYAYIPKGKRKPIYEQRDVTCVLNLIQCVMQAGALCEAFAAGVSFSHCDPSAWSPNVDGRAWRP